MKKIYLALAVCGFVSMGVQGQTILSEDFESDNTEISFDPNLPTGWTTTGDYLGNRDDYRWNVYYSSNGTISGTHCASCDATMYTSISTEGIGPREEILFSPELTLDDNYQLSFNWKAASASALENEEYELQVRVVVDGDVANAQTIWSFFDPAALKDSGVTTFPWKGWQVYNSKIGLEAYKGKTVKLAFVYKMKKETANVVYLDDVIVKKYTPTSAPIANISKTLYNFGDVYIGEKVWSEVITLKNNGANGLVITGIDAPNGVGTTLVESEINLDKYETAEFQVSYSASLTSAADGNLVIHTTGGDVTIRCVANKVALPDDYTFEGFERGCPPVGWTGKGWAQNYIALEGDHSAYSGPSMDGASTLVTPRLDMSTGAQSISFTCFNEFDSDVEGAYPENDITLLFSTDGGTTWSTVWTAPMDKVNAIDNVNIDLGTPASDNCFLKWEYSKISFSGGEEAPELSFFYLDRVVLPKLYGAGGVPVAATCIAPANGAVDVFNRDVKLQWSEAQFAEGYRLFVGTDDKATNLVNGVDLGTATSYVIDRLPYATKYFWRVEPYNSVGAAPESATWAFTTLADQTISTFPYTESFEGEVRPPLGWSISKDQGTRWSDNSVNAFDGKYSMSASCYAIETESSLSTPDFQLPADQPLEISFYWGNGMPVELKTDETGLVENTTTGDDGIDATFFEINVDGAWKQLAILSDKNNEYWCHERIDLAEYAGKTVSFRWRYLAHNYMKSSGVGLDMITIEHASDAKATFSTSLWDAGKVNYNGSRSSKKPLTVINEGKQALTVASVSFATPNFSSTLAKGTVIDSSKAATFELTFNALNTAAEVNDAMTVAFTNGLTIELPVKGVALAADVAFFDFEDDTPGNTTPVGFTTIDVDHKPTTAMTGMSYPRWGEPFAFCVQDTENWNNVFNPVSGTKVLVAIAPADDSDADDWLISPKMKATANSHFSFYARNWNSVNSILPETPHSVEVLVSTTGNDATANFTTVMATKRMPYYNGKTYESFDVDLSAYAGQSIYVALRHTVTAGLAAFFDDLCYEHFEEIEGGITSASSIKMSVFPNPATSVVNLSETADVTITNINGAVVARANNANRIDVSDLAAGIYVLSAKNENGTFTTKLIKR